ncbi:MAG TPA: DNA methyltransferase [Polyangiaceae bacterium]|jgi:DNA modification methylase
MPKAKKAPAPAAAPTEPAAEWVATGALRPWGNNPRKNDDAVATVTESIRRFGFGAPILARRANGEIIAGHTRWKAAQHLGLDRVPVRFLDLDPVDAHLLALADNRLAEEASWDDEMLAAVLADLRAHDADLAATGFSDEELAKLLAEADAGAEGPEVPEPELSRADELQAKWATESGQLWTIQSRTAPAKAHRLFCGDSTRAADVERLMGPDRAECMWTDPPYGVAYVGRQASKLTIANDTLSGKRLLEFLSASFVAADAHALQKGAAVYVAHAAGAASLQFLLAFEHAGWRVHQTLVWVKDKMVLGHSDYHYIHEPILLGYTPASAGRRGRGGDGWYGDNAQTSVFEVPRPKSSDEHPTMKPPELVAAMVRNSSPPGGLVYEAFSGSGSTMAACETTGRACAAIEIDPKYVAVALERLAGMGLSPVLST